MLKLYLYGYLQQIRSSRRLENECRRNVELMWLLGRLVPDHKSIAEFRRVHREAVTETGAELVRLARSVGLLRGEWVAIDGSKSHAASSARSVREREALKRYLDQMESADAQEEVAIDPSAVAAGWTSCGDIRSRGRGSCAWAVATHLRTTCRRRSILSTH